MKKYFFVFMLVILFKPVQAESLEGKKIFRNEYMEIHIPQFFRIDSVFHFDMGTVYHLFDKKNNDMMWFYNGQSHYNQSFAVDTLTRNFVVNNKIDTIVNIDGQSYRKKKLLF